MAMFVPKTDAHWYTPEGQPAHDADLRKARKQNLFFSVTSVLKMWPSEFLQNWKMENVMNMTLENPRQEGEEVVAYKLRIAAIIERNLSDAAQWGRVIHSLFEHYALNSKFPEGVDEPFVTYLPLIEKWFSDNIVRVLFAERVMVNPRCGYGGTCDLAAETKEWGTALCDFKRRGFKDGEPRVYDTDPQQLEAYARCCDFKVDTLISVGVNRDEPQIANHPWPDKNRETYWKKFMLCYNMMCMYKNYSPMIQYDLLTKASNTGATPNA